MAENKDVLGELLADLTDEEGQPVVDNTADKYKELETKYEALEKEKLGLLAATKEERRKRQERDMRLSKVEGVLDTILTQRQQQGMESVTESEAAEATRQGLPVTYDDDGNGWIDLSQINQLLTPYQQKIMELEDKLQLTDNKYQAMDEAERVRQAIIGENEQYEPAAGRYRAARKWVEDQVLDHSQSVGRRNPMTSGEALSQVFDQSLRREFTEQFGDLDLIDIVTAEDSPDHFRRTMGNIAAGMEPDELPSSQDKMDSRFQRVLKKPSNLGQHTNAKAGQLSVYEKMNSLSGSEIVDELTDAQVDALLRAAGKDASEY
jgi:hypothetical protein